MSKSERRYRQRLVRPMLAFAALVALAVVLAPTGTASPPSSGIKQATSCLAQGALTSSTVPGVCDTSNLPGGSTVSLTVTIANTNSSTQSLGSVNFDAPASLPIGGATYVSGTGTGTQTFGTNTSSEIQLRNLNLPPAGSVSVTFNVTTPCAASGPLQWTVAGKQSNNFLGSGNDFSFTNSGLTSTIASGGCKLVWVTQPTSAKPATLITGAPFDPTGGAAGYVKVRTISGSCSSNCPTVPVNGTVTLNEVAGSALNNFTGNTAALVNGVAVFDGTQLNSKNKPVNNLMGTNAGTAFQLQATATGLTSSPLSDPFVIGSGEACGSSGCDPFNTTLDGNTNIDSSATGSGFNFLAINNGSIPAQVTDPSFGLTSIGFGCAGFSSVGAGAFEETDGRLGQTNAGTLNFTYYVSKALIAKKFGSNSGQPFMPFCVGVQQINTDGSVQPCTDGTPGGWNSFAIDSTGAFTGGTTKSVCYGGFWWGILGTSSGNPKIDPATNPVVTGWDSNTTYRFFYVQIPSGWDAKGGM